MTLRRTPKPRLWRLARYVRWASLLATVIVILFIVSVIYSAFVFARHGNISVGNNSSNGNGGSGGGQIIEIAPGVYEELLVVNITNPSWYTFQIDISANSNALEGTPLGAGTSNLTTVVPGTTSSVRLVVHLDANSFQQDTRLLTNDTTIRYSLWLNGTYATIFTYRLTLVTNETWDAPFQGLAVVPGTPTTTGTTVTEPVAVNFTDQSSNADSGTISFQVYQPDGTACGSASDLNVDDDPGQSFEETVDITAPQSCFGAGDYVQPVYTSAGGLVVDLPTESVP